MEYTFKILAQLKVFKLLGFNGLIFKSLGFGLEL